ncbi:Zinc finger protein 26 [Lucilia cuprina]|nr:Zinc finger protein 26 [Lucilia cuprina]
MLTAFVMPNDLSDLCRVCLQLPEESQYLDLTTIYDEDDHLTYGECFTICTQIDLSAGEGVPHHLCKPCGLELQMSYDFHKKIEESKRVIEQCQKQIEEQKRNSNTDESEGLHTNTSGEGREVVQLLNEKYVISDDEEDVDEERAVSSQEMQNVSIMQSEFNTPAQEDDETDEMNIINKICHIEDKDTNTTMEHMDEHDVANDAEEMDDYQNLETLEDEETETLQIKCGENTIPIQVTKYNTIKCGVNEEYVEYAEEEENVEDEGVAESEQDKILNEEYAQEPNDEDIAEHLRWQDNVVAVASKEHLPIEIEDDDDDDNDEQEEGDDEHEAIYETNENHIIIEDSSHDDKVEDETIETVNNNDGNNTTTRKRHVGSYSCDYCHRVFPNYSRMKTHRRCHEKDRPKFSCSQCGRMYATKQARDCHVQTAHEKSGFTCSICNKVFAIRKSLEIHVRYHTGDFPHACNLCDKKFAQVCHLNTHINVKHNKIRFSCDYPGCGKFFTSSTSLRNHEFTHGIMPFECEYCQQGYPAKAKLRIHILRKHGMDLSKDQLENMRKFHVMRSKVNLVQFERLNDDIVPPEEEIITNTTITPCIPAGIRLPLPAGPPFICEFCGHSSKTKALLASHRHRKHRHKESAYQCEKCDQQFSSKDVYDKHLKRVSCQKYPEFQCEFCSKKIIGSANYKIHLRFHKKIYPFECDQCGKGFMLAVHLKVHKQTKHENKRYVCEEANCGKFFKSQQSLKNHTYVHLGSLPYSCEYCGKMFTNRGSLRWHLKTCHGREVTGQDLERMLVSAEISIKAEVQSVEFCEEEDKKEQELKLI